MIWISFKPLLDFKLFFFKTWLPVEVRYMLFYKLARKAWMYRYNMVNKDKTEIIFFCTKTGRSGVVLVMKLNSINLSETVFPFLIKIQNSH